MTPDPGNFNQNRDDGLEREMEAWELGEMLDPDFDGPTIAPAECDEYAEYDDETADPEPAECDEYEKDRQAAMLDLQADDEHFEADREADYEYELTCRASGKAA
jgi:hypothetical protein